MTLPPPQPDDPLDYASPSPPSLDSPATPADQPHDPYIALRQPNYRRYFIGNGASIIGAQMAGVTVGWELYARTNSAVALGMVGLVQVLPIILLALPAGHLVDHFNRKKLIMLATSGMIIVITLMGFASRFSANLPHLAPLAAINQFFAGLSRFLGDRAARFDDPYVPILFILLLLNGVGRSINQPAKGSLLPNLVEPAHFPNAVTWNASLFETSNVVGPMLAGFAIAALSGLSHAPDVAFNPWTFATLYWTNAALQTVQLVNIARIRLDHTPRPREPITLKSLLAGVHFVWNQKVILAAITLDMFAVLLGGATALLPLFAKDILNVGPIGLGWLRAAPSIGALTMALIIAHMPPMKNAGRNLLIAVAGFGAATILFGLSRNFWLSLAALILTGAFDNISVVIRHTLVQLLTPDPMRGRVNAVNSVFISTSNELGAFESGTTAALGIRFFGAVLGPMLAVAAGGVGTIAVVVTIAYAWPQLARVRKLHPESSTAALVATPAASAPPPPPKPAEKPR